MEDHRVNFDEGVTITIEVVGGCHGKQAIAHAVGDLRDSVVESMPEMISGGYVFKFGRAINNYSGDTYLTPIGTAHYDNELVAVKAELVETKSKLEKVTGEYDAVQTNLTQVLNDRLELNTRVGRALYILDLRELPDGTWETLEQAAERVASERNDLRNQVQAVRVHCENLIGNMRAELESLRELDRVLLNEKDNAKDKTTLNTAWRLIQERGREWKRAQRAEKKMVDLKQIICRIVELSARDGEDDE